MANGREFRWKIGAYNPETMPLGRLLEYLQQLALLLGESKKLHLIKIDSSSTTPVLRIDDEVVEHVQQRATEVRLGVAPTMHVYHKINRMLEEDKTEAGLYEGTAEIIPFPGRRESEEAIFGIYRQGSLDGSLQKVGGAKAWVPLQLEVDSGECLTGCYARRSTAKEMGKHLFDPIRLYGRGRWNRTGDGGWVLDKFWVDSFEPLDDTPLIEVVSALRAIQADWNPDPVSRIRDSREEAEEE
jgi:hypothetical protein